MGADHALFLLHELVWAALIIGGPILIGTMLVGLLISVFQVATQLQEATLSYVPKLLVAAVMLIVLGGWMLGRLNQFALTLYQSLPTIAG
jgi:flagellar biosynthetic protein FliQ